MTFSSKDALQFAPVFGEYKANVLSPFGTIRYPIIFEWLCYEEADQYSVSIEGSDWSFNTSDTHIELTEKDLKLNCGKEYMWELKVMKGEEVIDEITGFFSLISQKELEEVEEIEHYIEDIEPEEDRLLLFGEILERKKLFIEAIQKYKQSYALQPFPGLAYRIAFCYDKLELEELRDEWKLEIG